MDKNNETPVLDWAIINEKSKTVSPSSSNINTIWFS